MLKDAKATVSFSVKDIDEAKKFYADTLGLNIDDSSHEGMFMLKLPGDYQVMVYARDTHKPASYTLLNFMVNDLTRTMDELKTRGVVFEHYDLSDCKTDEQGVADYGMMKIAFFNDPSGNNHAVMQMSATANS